MVPGKEPLSKKARSIILKMQLNEMTECVIYNKIADKVKDKKNKETLLKIANEERKHAIIWESYTHKKVDPDAIKVFIYYWLAVIFGYTFALKKMEAGEEVALHVYEELSREVPEAKRISEDEDAHEKALIAILDEERLQYVGSMVLGLNDALVELTGTLAGLTLALQNTKLIALSGLITGISATLSMASSEYLSARSEGREDAFKSCAYTGVAYCITVALLVLPYLIFTNEQYLYALGMMLITVVLIILFFTYYVSVAKDLNFKSRFFEMAAISLGVAAFSFIVGLVVKEVLGIEI